MTEDNAVRNLVVGLIILFVIAGGYAAWRHYQASQRHPCSFKCQTPISNLSQVNIMYSKTFKTAEAKAGASSDTFTIEINEGTCEDYVATYQDKQCMLLPSR